MKEDKVKRKKISKPRHLDIDKDYSKFCHLNWTFIQISPDFNDLGPSMCVCLCVLPGSPADMLGTVQL